MAKSKSDIRREKAIAAESAAVVAYARAGMAHNSGRTRGRVSITPRKTSTATAWKNS